MRGESGDFFTHVINGAVDDLTPNEPYPWGYSRTVIIAVGAVEAEPPDMIWPTGFRDVADAVRVAFITKACVG